jgi:parallel beta-helix repeat protein
MIMVSVGMLTMAFNIQLVKSQGNGTIYINADGSVSPSTAPISTVDNITYTLTGNIINESIVVQRNNIVLDGAGYKVQGTGALGSDGIDLSSGNNNVTVKKTQIENFENGIILYFASSISISGNNITNNGSGVYLYSSPGNSISGNNITANIGTGVYFYSSSRDNVSGNDIKNSEDGIWLDSSPRNDVSGNRITNNNIGILFYSSSSNTSSSDNSINGNDITANINTGIVIGSFSNNNSISRNNITNNNLGVGLGSSNNRFFHNNFINNTYQVFSDGLPNTWDDGYPSGGNYWSNYNGTDLYSGPYQNVTGSDGLGDKPYIIAVNNTDRYPLMHPWSPLPVHDINTGLGYTTIQEAIDAPETLSGHVIWVDEGMYPEHVTITKSISLIGEDKDVTIIDGGGTGTVIQISASNVSIVNFTIRNAGKIWYGTGYPDSCVSGNSVAYVHVENNILTDAAVCAWFSASSSVNVSSNVVSNATVIGVVGYASTNITMSQNLVYNCAGIGLHLDGNSTNCKIANNTATNCLEGIEVERSAGNLVEGNQLVNNNVSIWIDACTGPNVFRNNNMTSDWYNLVVWGGSLENFVQDIDTSNIANSRTVYYITNSHDLVLDPSNCPNLGYLAVVNCTDVTVKDIDLSHSRDGLLMAQSTNCTFMNMTISNNRGPLLWGGLTLFDSAGNSVINSRITNNTVGVCLCQSSGNLFYHNSFVEINNPVISNFQSPSSPPSGSHSTNAWDNGYPSGGNYWSDYSGIDEKSGPGQNVTGSDGIGDTPHIIDANNTDRYPLMGPFHTFNVGTWNGVAYSVDTVSNSTISNFSFNSNAKTLTFNVTGTSGTTGFCRVAIPLSLMSCVNLEDWKVTVNGKLPLGLNVTTDANHTYIYFTYHHSTEMVKITSTSAVPEFQPFMLLPLFMVITLLGVIFLKKKRKIKTQCPVNS